MPNSDTMEISNIVSDLMKAGAMIPEKEWASKCVDKSEMMFDSIAEARTLSHAFLSSPTESMTNWDVARIDGQRELINSLEGEGFLPPGSKDMLDTHLTSAIDAIKRKDWLRAAASMQSFGNQVENYLPQWISLCSCVRKGDIISSVYYGINVHKEIDPLHKNLIWSDQIASLNRHGVLTNEEADRLLKVRW